MTVETEPGPPEADELERPHTGGKPAIPVTAEELERLGRLNCTLAEAASFFKCSKRTVQRYLEQPELKEAWAQGRRFGRLSLRRIQWRHANGTGASAVQMTIHLSKHWLGETDKVLNEHTGKGGGPIEVNVSVRDRIRSKLARLAATGGTGAGPREPE
jgi:hypothetical protein